MDFRRFKNLEVQRRAHGPTTKLCLYQACGMASQTGWKIHFLQCFQLQAHAKVTCPASAEGQHYVRSRNHVRRLWEPRQAVLDFFAGEVRADDQHAGHNQRHPATQGASRSCPKHPGTHQPAAGRGWRRECSARSSRTCRTGKPSGGNWTAKARSGQNGASESRISSSHKHKGSSMPLMRERACEKKVTGKTWELSISKGGSSIHKYIEASVMTLEVKTLSASQSSQLRWGSASDGQNQLSPCSMPSELSSAGSNSRSLLEILNLNNADSRCE